MPYTKMYMITVGIDEVGRGCWAGPLVAGAVVLKQPILGLKDSKKLSAKQRQRFTLEIEQSDAAIGLGWVWPEEIDEHGVTWSVKTAMERALARIETKYDEVIIDGNINYLPLITGARCVIKADDTIPAVSAASIVAKVARDTYMATQAHKKYPDYEFASHVGYGTKRHIELLNLHGVTSEHRKSYKPIQKLLGQIA